MVNLPLMAISKVCNKSLPENEGIVDYNKMYGADGSADNPPVTYLHHYAVGRLYVEDRIICYCARF
jgi:hypothetical protein